MGDNNIGDAGGQALSACIKSGAVPALQELDVSDNNVGEAGGLALAEALSSWQVPQLAKLEVGGNRLGGHATVELTKAIMSGALPLLPQTPLPLLLEQLMSSADDLQKDLPHADGFYMGGRDFPRPNRGKPEEMKHAQPRVAIGKPGAFATARVTAEWRSYLIVPGGTDFWSMIGPVSSSQALGREQHEDTVRTASLTRAAEIQRLYEQAEVGIVYYPFERVYDEWDADAELQQARAELLLRAEARQAACERAEQSVLKVMVNCRGSIVEGDFERVHDEWDADAELQRARAELLLRAEARQAACELAQRSTVTMAAITPLATSGGRLGARDEAQRERPEVCSH